MEDGKVIVKKIVIEEEAESAGSTQTGQGGEMQVLVSGVITKEGRKFARVSFMRGKDWAEGTVPDGTIERSEGFTQEELTGLSDYLKREKDVLLAQAKGVNPLRNMLMG